MSSSDADEPAAAPARAKRSLFKKSNWSAPADDENEASIAFFSRANELFIDIAEENARRRREDLTRAKASAESKRLTASTERGRQRSRESKRRRVSASDEDGVGSSASERESGTSGGSSR